MAESEVLAALSDTPVVLIHGPRQCGKSTLAKLVGEQTGARYLTLDDPIPREMAVSDPAGFIEAYQGPIIVDEAQRAPELFLALKASVDCDRSPGRFLLTGSANVMVIPKVADSLAGRIALVDLLPFSQSEIEGERSTVIDQLFDPAFTAPMKAFPDSKIFERASRGGFPEPYLRGSVSRRHAWFGDYVRTLLERDVRDIANIEGLVQMPKVLRLVAARAGQALNVVGLSRETQIPNTSLHRYLELLEAVFLTQAVPAWSTDRGVRLIKSPKTFLVDSGLLCYLTNRSGEFADPDEALPLLRNFTAMELKKLCYFSERRPTVHHLRTVRQLEVDFVLEDRSGQVVGIQVKSGRTLRQQDADGLRFLKELAGKQFIRGIVLYDGSAAVPMDSNIFGLPFSALWTGI